MIPEVDADFREVTLLPSTARSLLDGDHPYNGASVRLLEPGDEGAQLGKGQKLLCPAPPHEVGELTGAILTRYFDETTRSMLTRNTHRFGEVTAGRRCVGVEYPMIAQGHQHFALFHRTLPWDHAPGVLLIEEAGGRACRLDGAAYRPAQMTNGLLIAADEPTWTMVRDNLLDRTEHREPDPEPSPGAPGYGT